MGRGAPSHQGSVGSRTSMVPVKVHGFARNVAYNVGNGVQGVTVTDAQNGTPEYRGRTGVRGT